MSSYKQIDGVQYDKALLDLAQAATVSGGVVSNSEAEELWKAAQEGKGLTDCVRRTLQYTLSHFKYTEKAKEFMQKQLNLQQTLPSGSVTISIKANTTSNTDIGIRVNGKEMGEVFGELYMEIHKLTTQLKEKDEQIRVINDTLRNKADTAYVDKKLAELAANTDEKLKFKADKAAVDKNLAELAANTEEKLNLKADKASVDKNLAELAANTDEKLNFKSDKASVDKNLAELAANTDEKLKFKADTAHVDKRLAELDVKLVEVDKRFGEQLSLKADTSYVNQTFIELDAKFDEQFKLKADMAYVEKAVGELGDVDKKLDEQLKLKADMAYVEKALGEVGVKIEGKAEKGHHHTPLHPVIHHPVVHHPPSPKPEPVLSAKAVEVKKKLEVALQEQIDFKPSSSEVVNGAKNKVLVKVANVLKDAPEMRICVEGHTGCKCIAKDARTSPGKRQKIECRAQELSDDRADSVITVLKELGCKNNMVHKGHGCLHRIGMAVKVFPKAGQ